MQDQTEDLSPHFDVSALSAALAEPAVKPEGSRKLSHEQSPTAPRIEGYVLRSHIQSRGPESVWRGSQLSTGLEVSVRVFESPDARLKKELELVTSLGSHPYILNTLAADLNHRPPYWATSWLDQTLLNWTKTRAHSADLNRQVALWLQQAATALLFLHQQEVIHCGLQPASVLLDRQETLRISDLGQTWSFGHLLRCSSVERLYFAAPQQIQASVFGDRRPEPNWDIFALGAIFYQTLTSFLPRSNLKIIQRLEGISNGAERLASFWGELQQQRLRPIRSYNSEVDIGLAIMIERCLQLEPENRYESSADLISDLSLWRPNQPHWLDQIAYGTKSAAFSLGL